VSRFRLSAAADADMRSIAEHTREQWGLEQRDAYIGELFEAFARLAASPEMAAKIDHVRKGYRKFSHRSHVVFFRQSETHGIEIIRVLHKRMDVEAQLASP